MKAGKLVPPILPTSSSILQLLSPKRHLSQIPILLSHADRICQLVKSSRTPGQDHFHLAGGYRRADWRAGDHAGGQRRRAAPVVSEPGGQPVHRIGGCTVQHLQRWCAGKLRHLLAGDHALHQRVDHVAADGFGHPAVVEAAEGGRRTAENRAVDPLRDSHPVCFPRISVRQIV